MNTPAELKEVAHEAAREAVRETFLTLGIDVDNHESLQDTQADLAYMRKLRSGSEDMAKVVKRSAISIAFLALAYIVWEGIKSYVGVG